MEYTIINELKVPRIAIGTWAIGGWMWGGTDEERSVETLKKAIDNGLTLIDTAPVYGFGKSEEIVGKAIKDKKVIISTKVGLEWDEGVKRNASRERILKEYDDSLKRLNVDHIDIYFVHWPDPKVEMKETAEAMAHLFDTGRISAVGVSNFSVEQMEEFRKYCPIHVCQPPYNIFERDIEKDIKPYCKKKDIALMTYGAICRGLLSGKMTTETTFNGDDLRNVDPKFQGITFKEHLDAVEEFKTLAENENTTLASMSVRWILDNDIEISIWGARKPEQIQDIVNTFDWHLSQKTLDQIEDVLETKITNPVGPGFMAPPK